MKFYSIVNKKTLDKKEINKVFFNEQCATKFVKLINSKSRNGQEYGWVDFEYTPTKEEIEKYRVSAKKVKC